MQSLTVGSFPYLGKWEATGGPPSYHAVTVRAEKPRFKKFLGFLGFEGF